MKLRAPATAFRFVLPLSALLLVFSLRAAAAQSVPCGEGLELHVTSVAPTQGELVLVELKAGSALAEVRGGWAGQTLHFWSEDKNGADHTYRALLGVDLEIEASAYPLSISAELPNGVRSGCSASLSVRKGDFVVESLRVEERFVELSAKDLERSRKEARRLRRIFASVTPERLWKGAFRMPLDGFEGAGNFGKRRILNDEPRSSHSGEDFPAPAGTPVQAAQRGRVVLAGDLFFSGNTVILDHGLGLYTYYAHLQSREVSEGETVETGAVLGRVGATGRVTGPHLHWTVRLNEARVNPRDLVRVVPEGL